MPLLKDGQIVEDPWVRVADNIPLPANAPAIVTLSRWRSEREALIHNASPLGLLLGSDEAVEEVVDDIGRFDLIALDFPNFKDGSNYSTARLLRERYGYAGEIRAVGNVLRDQFAFMRRCGIDAFEVKKQGDADAFVRALDEIGVAYQPDFAAAKTRGPSRQTAQA